MNRSDFFRMAVAVPLAALGVKALPKKESASTEGGFAWRYPFAVGAAGGNWLYTGPAGEEIHEGNYLKWDRGIFVVAEGDNERPMFIAVTHGKRGDMIRAIGPCRALFTNQSNNQHYNQ